MRPAPGDQLASDIKALVAAGDDALARDRFRALVELHQRRASRIAYHYLRDAAEADEAVQDAFVKVFTKIATYREELPFAVWFNRVLVNGCLDRQKARARRNRWFVPLDAAAPDAPGLSATGPSPEQALLARERRARLARAVDRLPARQKLVLVLCHYDHRSTAEVGAMTGLSESTVRVHLFRALRKLRAVLEASGEPR